ncbi:hypothetical protein ACA910_001889 [Epithemia clementina (nom. ined.)]
MVTAVPDAAAIQQQQNYRGLLGEQQHQARETLERLTLMMEAQEHRERILEYKIQLSRRHALDKIMEGGAEHNNPAAALGWMRQMKQDQQEQAKVNVIMETLLAQVNSIESTLNQVDCVAVMPSSGAAATTMQKLSLPHGSSGSQDVDDDKNMEMALQLMGQVPEFVHYAAQVNALDASSFTSSPILWTDNELLQELADLQEKKNVEEATESNKNAVTTSPSIDALPVVSPEDLLLLNLP